MVQNVLEETVLHLADHPSAQEGLAKLFDLAGEIKLSFLYEKMQIQDSFSFRIRRRSLLVATYVIDEKGKIDSKKLDLVIALLEKEGYLFSPWGVCDSDLSSHMLFVLKKLKDDVAFQKLFQKFQGPVCHHHAEELVLNSLGIFSKTSSPSEAQIKRAVLSGALSLLRQNVGSCFATAPAILIQQEQLEKLFLDLYELLMTGKLKRTFLGVENSVPLSPSSGGGDLYRKVSFTKDLSSYPGLQASFQEIISDKEKLQTLLETAFHKKKSLQMRDLIHETLLLHFGLKEEDLKRHQESTKSFIKSKEFYDGVKKAASSRKTQVIEEMLLHEKKAFSAFKACTDHPLLKAWEYTIASFSEAKMEFSRFNLYASLGVHAEEKGGIGEVVYDFLQTALDADKGKLEEYETEYQIAYDQVRGTEALLKKASNESDARRLQAEFTTRVYHMRTCLEMRDAVYARASNYATFFPDLFKQYDIKFPEYFQEIYDADLREASYEEYEDSPAGFRLVYKHGRSNAFLWTMIYEAEEYIDALVDFFLLVEPQVAAGFSWDGAPNLIKEITTLIVSHVRTPEFLHSALERMRKIHRERGETGTPWAYLSGGSMAILLQTYYRRETAVTEETKKIESPADLLIFLLDTMKSIPLSSEGQKLLMSSPSHAFTLIPSLEAFRRGWQDDLFSYTWVRDNVIVPGKRFYEKMLLSISEQSFLLDLLRKKVPEDVSYLLHQVPCVPDVSVDSFKEAISNVFLKIPIDGPLDAFFYEMLPLVSGSDWKIWVERLLSDLNVPDLEAQLQAYVEAPSEFLSAKEVRERAKAFYLVLHGSCSLDFDLHKAVAKKAEEIGLAPPRPLLFADTNWSQFYFGLMVSPSTGELKLWRTQPFYGAAYPMSSWDKWFKTAKGASWSVCTRPFEYR